MSVQIEFYFIFIFFVWPDYKVNGKIDTNSRLLVPGDANDMIATMQTTQIRISQAKNVHVLLDFSECCVVKTGRSGGAAAESRSALEEKAGGTNLEDIPPAVTSDSPSIWSLLLNF